MEAVIDFGEDENIEEGLLPQGEGMVCVRGGGRGILTRWSGEGYGDNQ